MNRLRLVAAAAGIALVSPAFGQEALQFTAQSISAYQIYNYNAAPGLLLGTGFDTVTNQARSDCVKPVEPETAPASGGEAQMWMQEVESYSKLSQTLGFDSSASMLSDSGGFGAKGSLSLMNKVEMSEYSLYLTVNVVVSNALQRMRETKLYLEEPAEKILKNQGDEAFRAHCGDMFVAGYISGGEYRAVLEFLTSSRSEQSSLQAALSGTYQIFSASAELKGSIDRITQNRRTDGAETIGTTLETMVKDASEFPTVATGNGARTLYAIMQPYSTMSHLPKALSVADRRGQIDAIERMSVLYGEQKRLFNSASYVIAHPDEFVSPDAAVVSAMRNDIDNNMRALISAESACATDATICNSPDLKPVGQLPERVAFNLKNCKSPVYKEGTGPQCGVELYREVAAEPCPVAAYRKGIGAQCGVAEYNVGVGVSCGTEWVAEGRGPVCGINPNGQLKPDDRGYYEPYEKRDAWCKKVGFDAAKPDHPNYRHCIHYNTCQHESFGVRYKSCASQEFGVMRHFECESPDFGVASHQACRSEVFGPETFKTCRHEDFGIESCTE